MDVFNLQLIWDSVVSGGPIMLILALLSLILYWNIIGLLLFVMRVDLGAMEDLESGKHQRSRRTGVPSEIEPVFAQYEIALAQFREFIRSRLKYTHALLLAAPLLGLLGTVVGMLDSFRGLSLQAGYETMSLVAAGVHRALITTETGLVIAIPALFLIYWIRRVSKKRELELLQVKLVALGQTVES